MAWPEMSRNTTHGGSCWEFGTCLWLPTQRKSGGRWGYWDLMQQVRKDDVVLHLRGKSSPQVVGHSVADANCYRTTQRPPEPGAWDHAIEYFLVPLRDCCPLERPIALRNIFASKAEALTDYHGVHSPAGSSNGRFLFYVPQNGRLQCQNRV